MLSSKNTALVVNQRDLIGFDYTRRKMQPSTSIRTQDQRQRSHKNMNRAHSSIGRRFFGTEFKLAAQSDFE